MGTRSVPGGLLQGEPAVAIFAYLKLKRYARRTRNSS